MFFKKRPVLETPMDQFLHRDQLDENERPVLDLYMTGVGHALTYANTVQTSNGRDPLFRTVEGHSLEAPDLEIIVAEFLEQRPDMQSQPLGLCAVMAVLQRFPV